MSTSASALFSSTGFTSRGAVCPSTRLPPSVLSVLVAACFSLSACGSSSSDSSNASSNAASNAPSNVGATMAAADVVKDTDRFAAKGVALGDINAASSDTFHATANGDNIRLRSRRASPP